MTASVMAVGDGTAWLATDSLFWRVSDETPSGYGSKFMVLPKINAVVFPGDNTLFSAYVYMALHCHNIADTDALVEKLPSIGKSAWDYMMEHDFASDDVMKPQMVTVVAPGQALMAMSDSGFQPRRLPAKARLPNAFAVGPHLDDDAGPGGLRTERFNGDQKIVHFMRRLKAETTSNIGGQIQRARITTTGIETAVIGDLDAPDAQPPQPPAQPTAPAAGAKVGRNAPCPCGSGRKAKRCCQG